MRLKQIKLAGFKSFVDATTVPFPTELTAIVGPNGCGKSNIIDAVRWVMGESSAKHLRGDSMADVIFNGSSTRKPVGQASIELVFDNSDHSLGGEYAKYSEIALRREVKRDGQSNYYLNGTKCRRRDISDIFLGTGLGPRSYAIIEQGMISRLIESKPHELRVFLEEVAGISKYKERRKETESRMKRTKENLDRITDLVDELDSRLRKLKRQSDAAAKYKTYKQEERKLSAELAALQWQEQENAREQLNQRVQELSVELESRSSDRQAAETKLEQLRQGLGDSTEQFNQAQAHFYQMDADIAKQEQLIQHTRERLDAERRAYHQTEASLQSTEQSLTSDKEHLEVISASMQASEPQLVELETAIAEAQQHMTETEQNARDLQAQFEQSQVSSAKVSEQAEVCRTKIGHAEQQQKRLIERQQQLQERLNQPIAIDEVALKQKQSAVEQVEKELTTLEADLKPKGEVIQSARENIRTLDQALSTERRELEQMNGRFASLEALQQAALGQDDVQLVNWLQEQGVDDSKRLAEQITVTGGWEAAVETVLGDSLQALCLEPAQLGRLSAVKGAPKSVMVVSHSSSDQSTVDNSLADYVSGPSVVTSLLNNIIVADDVNQALQLQAKLTSQQSVITQDAVWLGPDWVRLPSTNQADNSVLERQKLMESIQEKIQILEQDIQEKEQAIETNRQQLKTAEQERDQLQSSISQKSRDLTQRKSQFEREAAEQKRLTLQREQWQEDINGAKQEIQQLQEQVTGYRSELERYLDTMKLDHQAKDELNSQRFAMQDTVKKARQAVDQKRQERHQLQIKLESLKTEKRSLIERIERTENQAASLRLKLNELKAQQDNSEDPVESMKQQLQHLLSQRQQQQQTLNAARDQLESLQHQEREQNQARDMASQHIEALREKIQRLRVDEEGINVRQAGFKEQLEKTEQDLHNLLERLPDAADKNEWIQQLEQINQRIQRLGAINLAAIEEYQTESERKVYLDTQKEDLDTALATLENAIRKIDRETRERFKETFETVNQGIQTLFPKVFGGGSAHLELTGDDLLDTGVTVMAQPPGKRNSSISQLSGGEKALTAISLVFSMFQINPAPFCMLDEVDAPLDDANVGRFCRLVQEMSKTVQFVYITHNKVAMEMGHQLMGVTMHEPGVSRIVAVDVEEAVAMAG